MPYRTLLISSSAKYKPLLWLNRPVHGNYFKIQSYLRSKLGDQFAAMLAQPATSGDSTDIAWISDRAGNNAVQLSSLGDPEKNACLELLNGRLDMIRRHYQLLEKSDIKEDRDWAQLLKLAFVYPDESHVFVDNGQIVLTGWGFNHADVNKDSTYSTGIDRGSASVPEPTAEPVNIPVEPPFIQPAPVETPYYQPEYVAPPPVEPPPPEVPPRKRRWSWNWGCLRWLLWALLLLLLVLLFAWLFKHCHGCGRIGSAPLLPEYPGVVVPVDPDKIVADPDSIRTIVANRLNIALVGSNKDIPAFASAFKQAYPSDEYQIIYYDTLIYRLQITVPENSRESLLTEIPAKLPAFEMLVWTESLFQTWKIPSDPGFQDPASKWYLDAVGAPGAWDSSLGSKNVVIAVLDSGFDLAHPELKGKIYKPWNVCSRTIDVSSPNAEGSMHGTHVAGIAAAMNDNGVGVAGLAPQSSIMPIRVTDDNGLITSSAVIDGVLYAIHQGAHVINLSIGAVFTDVVKNIPVNVQQDIAANNFRDEAAFWKRLFQEADERNITVVIAAGNENALIGIDPMQRSPVTIKVSAVDQQLQKASFSNFGSGSTISAPGVNIFSTVPGGNFKYLDGTSMAAPVVSGGVALIKSLKPDISNRELIQLLQRTGKPVQTQSPFRVGNLIQLDKALSGTTDGSGGEACSDVYWKIDSLNREIERLKGMCPNMEFGQDTMKMPVGGDIKSVIGRWRSTTQLSSLSGDPLTLYFDIYPGSGGKLTVVEINQAQFVANLSISLTPSSLEFNQNEPASNEALGRGYHPYEYTCKSDANGYADCVAQNKIVPANRVNFKLVKIQ
jgi:subtilisin family serine protease